MDRFFAVPLATRGFVPTDPISNPVRWYVMDEDRSEWLSRSFDTMAEADAAAAQWNAEIRCATCGEESGGKGSSMYGSVHKYGPVGHPFRTNGDAR